MDPFVSSVLSAAKIGHKRAELTGFKGLPGGSTAIVMTPGNQLLGTYRAFRSDAFRQGDTLGHYRGWEAHHVVEDRDLRRLGVTHTFPPYEDQLCVLLPAPAHRRINSILQRYNPQGIAATTRELRQAYRMAYDMMGDYCGGGWSTIRRALCAIADAIIARAVVHPFA